MQKGYMKLKKILVIIFIICFCMILLSTLSQAKDDNIVITSKPVNIGDFSKEFQKWLNMSDEEQKKYIEPAPYLTPYYDPVKSITNKIQLFSNTRNATSSTYDLREKIDITVKDQMQTQTCWVYPVTSSIETHISLTRGYKSREYSVRHMEYATSRNFLNDQINENGYNREVGGGGNSYIGYSYLTSGFGPVLEEDMPFENSQEKIDISEIQNKDVGQHVESYIRFPSIVKSVDNGVTSYSDGEGNAYTETQIKEIRDQMKEHIVQYGGIAAITNASQTQYFNNVSPILSSAYYCDDPDIVQDHAVTIIGWDDNYSKTNFNEAHRPSKDGAWLVLNSYGEGFNGGYYYISYEDVLIEKENVGVISVVDKDYKNIYQYDELGYNYTYLPVLNDEDKTKMKEIYTANVFEKKTSGQEFLSEISYMSVENTKADIYVNMDGNLDMDSATLIASDVETNAEFKNIKLNSPIEITGSKFVVIVKYKNDVQAQVPLELNLKSNGVDGENMWNTATASEGESYVSVSGAADNWQDLTSIFKDTNLCIKAFTKDADNAGPTINITPTGNTTYKTSQSAKVTASDTSGVNKDTLRYVWTQSTNQPLESSFKDYFENGGTIVKNTDTGTNWYLWVMAKDMQGNVTYKRSEAFYLDNTVPEAPMISSNVTSNVYTKENALMQISGSSAPSGIQKYQYSLNNGTSWNDVSGNIEISESGTYTMIARAISNVGIIGKQSAPFVIKIDKKPPVINGIVEGKIYKSVQPTITDETEITAILKKGEEEYSYYIDLDDKGDLIQETGDYTLIVTDELDNSTTVNFKIDSTMPVVTFTPNGNKTFARSHSVRIDITDNYNLDEDSLYYRWCNDMDEVTEEIMLSQGEKLTNGETVEISGITGMDSVLCVLAKDELGNTSLVKTNTFSLDNDTPGAPTISGNVSNGDETNENVILQLTGGETLSGIQKYQYSFDDGLKWIDISPEESITLSETGEYNIIARAVSNVGIEGYNSLKFSVSIDKVGPEITFTPDGNTTYRKEQSLQITATSEHGINNSSLKYLWTQEEMQPEDSKFSENYQLNASINKSTDSGIWYVWAKATDNLGNTSYQRSKGFYLDNTVPEAPIVSASIASGETTNKDVTVTISGSNSPSGISKYQYSLNNGGEWKDIQEGEEIRFSNTGTYNIIARAVNTVGTEGSSSDTYIIKINKELPEMSFSPNGSNVWKRVQSTTIQFPDISEINLDTLTYVWSQSETQPDLSEFINKFQANVPIEKNTDSGIWYLWARAENIYGSEIIKRSEGFYLDNETPNVPTIHSNTLNDVYTGNDVIIYLDGSTSPSGIRKYRYSFNNGTSWTDVNEKEEIKITEDGEYTFIASAVNNVGKAGNNTEAFIIKIDKTAPVIENIEEGKTYSKITPEVTDKNPITITLTKNGEVINYQLGEEINETGDYQLTAKDSLNNISSVNFIIDSIAPTIEFKPNGNQTYQKVQSTIVTVEDNAELDYSTLRYKWTTSVQVLTEETFLPDSQTFESDDTITLDGETGDNWYLWILAKDKAGNMSLVKSNVFYLDNTVPEPPIITANVENNDEISENALLNISGSNAPSGIAYYEISADQGKTWHKLEKEETLQISENGRYEIIARAVSNSGIEGRNTEPYIITVNKEKPTITFTPNGNLKYEKQQSSTIQITSNKELREDSLTYIWSQKSENVNEEEINQAFKNGETVAKTEGDGIWYIWAKAEDIIGEVAIVRSNAFYLDNTVPRIDGIEDGGTYEEVTPEIDDESDDLTVEVKKDGEDYPYELGDTIEEEGEYEMIIEDEAGNETTIHFKIEKENKEDPGQDPNQGGDEEDPDQDANQGGDGEDPGQDPNQGGDRIDPDTNQGGNGTNQNENQNGGSNTNSNSSSSNIANQNNNQENIAKGIIPQTGTGIALGIGIIILGISSIIIWRKLKR